MNNPYVIVQHDFETDQWINIPLFRTLQPYKNPAWFMKHEDLKEIAIWNELNIMAMLPFLTYITLGVLIRISTGMLNKCNVDEETKMLLHDNMVKLINSEFAKEQTKDLPF